MASHPWHPRVIPFVVYILFLAVIGGIRPHAPVLYPFLYALQCGVVLWLLWRYRALLPELTLKAHWLALPVGVMVAGAWVWLGQLVTHWDHVRGLGLGAFTRDLARWVIDPSTGRAWVGPDNDAHYFLKLEPAVRWPSLGLRLLGMSIVVPLFEELFIRSLLLRSFHSFRRTAIGVIQVIQDFPVVGEWMMRSSLAKRAGRHAPVFGAEFTQTPLGRLSVFGFAASTLVFMVHHVPRDWMGCVVCGGAYCVLLALTARRGLGPVVWAHGITNALLWAYTLHTGDWQFL